MEAAPYLTDEVFIMAEPRFLGEIFYTKLLPVYERITGEQTIITPIHLVSDSNADDPDIATLDKVHLTR